MQQIVRVPLYKELIMKSVRLFSLFVSIAFVHGLLGMEVEDKKLITLGAGRIPTYMSKRSGKVAEDISPGGLKTLANYFPDELQLEITQRLMKNHPVMPAILQRLKLSREKVLKHNGHVNAVAWSPNGSKVLTGSKAAKIWNAETGERLGILTEGNHYIWSVAWSPDGSKVLTGSYGGRTKIWNAETGERLGILTGGNCCIYSVAWSPDSSKVLTGSYGIAKIWNADTGECLHTLTHAGCIYSVAWNPDGSKVLTGPKVSKIWNADTGECLHTLAEHGETAYSSVAWSLDGSKVLTGSQWGTTKIWNADTGECLHIFTHDSYIRSVAWSPDGSKVLTGSYDGRVKILDAETGECLRIFTGHTETIYSVAWNPDGSKVLTGLTRAAKIWDISKLIDVENNLNKYQNLKQAFLLDIIYKEAIAKEKIIILSHGETELFHTLSPEVQHALRSHVILRSHATDSACTII